MRVALADDVDPRLLDAEARRELRSLSKDTADLVARHLVMVGRLVDDEPEQALAHARAARALAGRVAVVREAAGIAAYAAGEWSDALSELRAARRISGRPEHLAVLADCERALGRPERALAYGDDPQLTQLTQDQRVELVIVLAGARRDMGQADAAVVVLQDPAKRTTDSRPWAGRLWYAYADALLDAGREDEARTWFERAAAVDVDGETDAGDRLLALDGVVLEDGDEPYERDDLPTDDELAEVARGMAPLLFEAADLPAGGPVGPDAADGSAAVTRGAAAPEGRTADEAAPTPAVDVAGPRSGVALPPFVAPPSPDDAQH
jgi:tetratricopeptide (TPR) repeat protein